MNFLARIIASTALVVIFISIANVVKDDVTTLEAILIGLLCACVTDSIASSLKPKKQG